MQELSLPVEYIRGALFVNNHRSLRLHFAIDKFEKFNIIALSHMVYWRCCGIFKFSSLNEYGLERRRNGVWKGEMVR